MGDFIAAEEAAPPNLPKPTHHSTGLERSKCIFPASSNASTSSTERYQITNIRSIEAHCYEDELPLDQVAATIKAAWALTLQCFIVADVLCFTYSQSLDPSNEHSQESTAQAANLYVTRVERGDNVRFYTSRFLERQNHATSTDVEASAVELAAVDSQYHQCNTSLRFECQSCESTLHGKSSQHKIDLSMLVSRNATKALFIKLEYNTSYVDAAVATSVLNTFHHIWTQVYNASTDLKTEQVNLCPPDSEDLIRELTKDATTIESRCLHDMIIEKCIQQPNNIAVQSWDSSMTYGELHDLSSKLALHLVQLGVRPETFVLSCFDKSIWPIVVRLAILMAGGAYISVHASNPPVYLQSVIDRTKASILITEPRFAERFRDFVPQVVALSSEWIHGLPTPPLGMPICANVRPDNACLVLFTSGSTGTPKGIVQTHASYATGIRDYAKNFKLGKHTRYLQFDDYAFGISDLEFLVPLTLGGVCCVPGPMRTVEDLATQIRLLNANITFLTPTVAIKLEPQNVPCLEVLCVGGEPLPKDLVRKWNGQRTRLINQYGMGETGICSAFNDHPEVEENAEIGLPCTGTMWVVDPTNANRLLPIGAVGEIVHEGPHLSRGYLDPTALGRSDAGFVELAPAWLSKLHPSRPKSRMYKSGDLGRMSEDGKITYIGRKDTIFKLDGCRVDALEVEFQARRFLSIKDTIVIDLLGTVDGRSDPTLTAYIHLEDHPFSRMPHGTESPQFCHAEADEQATNIVERIKQGISDSLPKYMIPTTFMLMSWVPRTASKKLDRKRIHALGQAFYSNVLARRSKDVDYALRMKVLPPMESCAPSQDSESLPDHDFHSAWGSTYSARSCLRDSQTQRLWSQYMRSPSSVERQYHNLLNSYTNLFAEFFDAYYPISLHAHATDALFPTTIASLILNTIGAGPLILDNENLRPKPTENPDDTGYRIRNFSLSHLGWTEKHVLAPTLVAIQGIYGAGFGPLAHTSNEWEIQAVAAGPRPIVVSLKCNPSQDELDAQFESAKEAGAIAVLFDMVSTEDGTVLPPAQYAQLLIAAQRNRLLVIVDETMTAIRCGAPFAFQRKEYSPTVDGEILPKPDLVIFGKGLGLSGVAIGFDGVLTRKFGYSRHEDIAQTILYWRALVSRPVRTPILIEALGVLRAARAEDWPSRSERIGETIRSILHELEPSTREPDAVRGLGAMIALNREITMKYRIQSAIRRRSPWVRWLPKLDAGSCDRELLLKNVFGEESVVRRKLLTDEAEKNDTMPLWCFICGIQATEDSWCRPCYLGVCNNETCLEAFEKHDCLKKDEQGGCSK